MEATPTKKTAAIILTEDQLTSLVDFYETGFVDYIRNDTGIENIQYIANLCDIYKLAKEAYDKIKKESGAF